MNSDELYSEFVRISKKLNHKLRVTPILYGSLGLELVTGHHFSPQDIDILVPHRFISVEWDILKITMEELEYNMVDLHEHKFLRGRFEVGFSFEEDLMPFAEVDYNNLKVMKDRDVTYRLLTLKEYHRVYNKSIHDSYRRSKNNSKDLNKIEVLEALFQAQ